MSTRRHFLAATLAAPLASRLEAAEPQTQADREKFAGTAILLAKKAGATYSDIRINRYHDQNVGIRLSPERGTGKTLEVQSGRFTINGTRDLALYYEVEYR